MDFLSEIKGDTLSNMKKQIFQECLLNRFIFGIWHFIPKECIILDGIIPSMSCVSIDLQA